MSSLDSSTIDYDTRLIKSKKYKTIGELKTAGLKSIIQTTARMNPSFERDYLDKWLFDTYYSKKDMWGNLTDRIGNINNKICYREIMKRCFDNIDIISNHTHIQILSKPTIDFIDSLHSISPSIIGSFIDYLIRRIISELLEKKFIDSRANCGKCSMNHLCNTREMCKYNINHQDKCVLPLCQIQCCEKTTDTINYKTKDIIPEIFITSLSHGEAFGGSPSQDHFDKIYEKLINETNKKLVEPLTELCNQIIKNKSDILLNPVCGGKLDDIDCSIPSDADLVIDDILIDIKCTKTSKTINEITQLLGYSSLLMLNKRHRRKINKISIMNVLSGFITTYNIDFVTKENCINYIKILTNKYKI